MKLLIFFFSIFFITIVKSESTDQPKICDYSNFTHPFKCCRYPMLILPEETYECYNECNTMDNCCKYECVNNITPFFDKNGKMNKEEFVDVFISDINNEKTREVWKEIIEKSVEKCENYGEIKFFYFLI